MKIKPEQLSRALEQSLAPVYLLTGEEPLFIQECRDQIIQAGKKCGFLERSIYEVHAKYDWDIIAADAAERSLFSPRRVFDLRLASGKPGMNGGKFLTRWADDPDPEYRLIVSCTEWDSSCRKSAWAGRLAAVGVQVEIWPLKPAELPAWIGRRMRSAGLAPDTEAIHMLAELVEGNLFAASQEIEKLRLAATGRKVTVADIATAVAASSRFDAFRLGASAFDGNAQECLRVTAALQRNGMVIQALTGALYYQLNQLREVCSAVGAGENEAQAFRRLRVFGLIQPSMHQALRRLGADQIDQSFRFLALLDRQSKGQAAGDPWQTLDEMLLGLCGVRQATDPCGRAG